MIGIGIVTYNDLINRNTEDDADVFDMTCECIETIAQFTEDDYIIIVRDNDSLDYRYRKFNVTLDNRFKDLNTLFIPSKVNELTDAWNEILTLSFDEYNCEAAILLNNDVIITKYWQPYIEAIKVQSRDLIGPVATDAPYQPIQSVVEEAFMPEDTLFQVQCIQGNCLGGSKRAFKENMYDDTHYFDPEVEFAFNEEEWVQRHNASGGRVLIAMNSYIIHLNKASWHSKGLWSTKAPDEIISSVKRVSITDVIDYNDFVAGNCVI